MAEKRGVREKAYISDHELSSDFVEGQKWKGNYALKKEVKDEPIRKIKVTKLPDGAVEETLMNYFENMRRNGGGPIENIEYHPATSSAIIEFQETEAVDRVLKKRPLLFLKRQISVEEYVEKVEEEEEGPSSHTIEVHGFVENTSQDVLEMYFENSKRSGGSEVTSVVIEGDVALVTFTDKNVASSVCEREHTLSGRKLNVSLHLPKKKSSAMEAEIEEAEEPVCTVEVRGYKVGSEGTIELYFENTKRSGGDEIVNFDPINSDGVIFITFESNEVAKRVSEHQHTVAGCTLDVKLYEPPKRKSTRKWSKICSKQPVPHCVVAVRGVTRRIIETVPLYFENKRRSGGGEIVKFEYKEENGIAYITYESEEVARRVVTHRQHKLEGQPLKVKLFIPPQPRPHYEDRVLFVRLTSKITRDGLINFLEAKIGLTPAEFFFGEEGDKVIIRFNEKIDFQKLEEVCKKRALEGSHLQPSKVPVSNCILVLNLKLITTEDTIELYFENEKRSWGGPVEKVEFNRGKKYCLVYFEDHTICEQVLQRKHKIDGSDLQVSVYYECLGRTSEDDTGPCSKFPKPVKLEGLEFPKMNFECKSFEPNWLSPEKKLQDCLTQMELPQTLTGFMAPTCTLSSDVQVVKKNEQDDPIRKIKVTELPEYTTEDVLMSFFENRRRSGGGPIENIEYHPATSSAIIEFQEADAVDRVLKKAPLLFLKKQISVEEYIEEVEDAEEEEEEPSCRTIEVRGFTENTWEEVLETYFENPKRSGGGDVTSVVIEGGVALVTFSDENVARRVVDHKYKVADCNLDVKLYEPPKHKSVRNLSRTTSKEPEESVPHCTIEVRGVTSKIVGTLQLYFENKRRSGGEEIVHFDYREENETAYITYESEEVAKRVVSHGQHRVDGQSLEVKLYIPPPPRPTYEDRVLLAGLSSKVTQDGLTNFLEARTGLTPVKFLYGEDKGRVIITFKETVDFEKLEEACKKRPLEGSYLQPSKVHVSNCIIIFNLKITTTEDTIEFYFENEKWSWGGPVEKVEFNREEECCLVYFENHTSKIYKVLCNLHRFSND